MTTYAFEPAMFSLFSLTGPSCLCKWCKHVQVPTTYCSHESRDSGSLRILRHVSLSAVRTSVWFGLFFILFPTPAVSCTPKSEYVRDSLEVSPSSESRRVSLLQVLGVLQLLLPNDSISSMYHALPLSSCADWQWSVTQAPGRGKQLRLLPQALPSAFKETFRSCRKMSWTRCVQRSSSISLPSWCPCFLRGCKRCQAKTEPERDWKQAAANCCKTSILLRDFMAFNGTCYRLLVLYFHPCIPRNLVMASSAVLIFWV